MAMKLNAELKAIDSAVRSFNTQLENAYRKLGYSHPVTRNLVATAKSVFGAENVRTQPTKYIRANQLDTATGEYHEIVQVGRGKKQLEEYGKKKLVNGKRRTAIETLNSLTRTKEGNYNRLYNVTTAHQSAINKIRQSKRQNVPESLFNIKDEKQRQQAIVDYITPTNDEIRARLGLEEIASALFEAYELEKSQEDEYSFDLEEYREFAHQYHSGDYNTDRMQNIIERALQARRERLNQLETYQTPTGQRLSDFDI